ncbi:MAG: hypothetical protein O3A53_07305 [Acidobacteria bacterium]|nr:hypothetical protein [Acidobacteriota bacterium]MDA1234592.1 hypothetical protein [Acidobacteriota bacterium]
MTEYDREGRVTLWESQGSNGYVSRMSNYYDASGRMTGVESEYGEGKRSVSRHVYDEGKLIRIEGQNLGGIAAQPTLVEQKPDGGRVHIVSLVDLPTTIEGVKLHYDMTVGMHGAASRREEYDSTDRKTLISFLDKEGKLLSTIQYIYDEAGLLIEENQTFGDVNPIVEGLRAEAPAAVVDVLASLMGQGAGRRVTYRYYQQGREVEQRSVFPPIVDETVRREYNERGDISRQTMESMHRGFSGSLEELREMVEPSTLSVTECEYEYDARDNWIRRVSRNYSQGSEGEAHESTSTRLIDYYD